MGPGLIVFSESLVGASNSKSNSGMHQGLQPALRKATPSKHGRQCVSACTMELLYRACML